jgi:hypothetical protein
MWTVGRKEAAYDLTRFAGSIKTRGLGFFHIVKFLIAISILLAIFMLTVK